MNQAKVIISEPSVSKAEFSSPRVRTVSVIVPVKDEADSVLTLLDALASQTRMPDEIVLADGGSSDGTQQLIRDWIGRSSIPTTLIEQTHGLPGRNRNVAVEAARHEWIAAIDAGIHPPLDWLESLIQTAEEDRAARVVFGRYVPLTETRFAEYAGMTYAGPGDVERRSIATCLMERSVWQEVGGCPEHLRSGEDLVLFNRLDEHQIPVAYSHGTPVQWELQPTVRRTFRRFVVYSQNGMRAGLFEDWQFRVMLQYAVLTGLLIAGAVWSRWFWFVAVAFVIARSLRRISVWHHSSSRVQTVKAMLDPGRVLSIAALNIVIDVAMFVGVGRWLVQDVWSDERGTLTNQLQRSTGELDERVTA